MSQERENNKGILFGILGILTLIIAIMGASLAYFTATSSQADESIEVQSALVTITYVQGDILSADELIPSDFEVVKRTYSRTDTDKSGNSMQCKDEKGYQVCSVFRFKASNEKGKTAQSITGRITTKTDELEGFADDPREFENLKFAVFKVNLDEEGNPVINEDTGEIERTEIGSYACHSKFKKTTDDDITAQLFNKCTGAQTDEVTGENPDNVIELAAGEIGSYEIVIWLDETRQPQDEQGLRYKGQLEIGVSGISSEQITGKYDG